MDPPVISYTSESIGEQRALEMKDFLQKLFTNIAHVNSNPKCIESYKDKLCIFLFSLLHYNLLWKENFNFYYPATGKDNWKEIYNVEYENIFKNDYMEIWRCFRTFVDYFNR